MHKVESLVLVGPPRAGKDTLASGVATAEFAQWANQVVVPRRFATRPYHSSEDGTEWTQIDDDELEQDIAKGKIGPAWDRKIDIYEPPAHYAFASVEPTDKRLRIYSANFPILEKEQYASERAKMLSRAALVHVHAEQDTMLYRLKQIKREMPDSEYQARKRKITQNPPPLIRPSFDIWTEGMEPSEGQEMFRNLVEFVLRGGTPWGWTIGKLPPAQAPKPSPSSVTFDDRKPLG